MRANVIPHWRRIVGMMLFCFSITFSQVPPDPVVPPGSLKLVPIPEPANLALYVTNKPAAIRLGKALFWDMQVGSDGVQACASCHFQAGADNRVKNQLSPGLNAGDLSFALGHGPNSTVTSADFPRPKSNNDVTSSQGVFGTNFVGSVPENAVETGTLLGAAEMSSFKVNGIQTRRVEPRNTPTTINAVFLFRNFWDGRANFHFNGSNPFGPRDPNAGLYFDNGAALVVQPVLLDNASLASQAAGPPGSDFEMSFGGRTFRDIARKLFTLKPLVKQLVDRNDGVLGVVSEMRLGPNRRGLTTTYRQMIRDAFAPNLWNSAKTVDGFAQDELNFSFFFSLSVQLYEATLVSDDSPFDRAMEGRGRLNASEQRGFQIFLGQGNCVACHAGAEFTNAATRLVLQQAIDRMPMGNGAPAVYDEGFYNIGVRQTNEDIGLGGTDPISGRPLSFARQVVTNQVIDQLIPFDPNAFTIPGPIVLNERIAVDGAFKTPTIRNVELTGPYFHNGGMATLKQVVQFYNRGGDFPNENIDNLDVDIMPLGLTPREEDDLVAFMLTLTDNRVKLQKAPFDHPQLFIPNGHPGSQASVTDDGSGKATDALLEIPRTGAAGGVALRPFLNANPFSALAKSVDLAEGNAAVPTDLRLEQNFPNPFNPTTKISFQLPADDHVTLKVYNALGQEVATLANEFATAGQYEVTFDAAKLASGVYIYTIKAGNLTASKKMLLVK